MCSHARKKLQQLEDERQKRTDLRALDWKTATPEQFKEHFTSAYDEIGSHAKPLLSKAHVAATLMGKLGYTDEELKIIGEDVQLMQGTGNPHVMANISTGDVVVDLGSGFGIDSILALIEHLPQ